MGGASSGDDSGSGPSAARTSHWADRRDAARARLERLRARLESQRPNNTVIDVGFRFIERDREIAGAVLGGGLAYRLFFVALSLAVLFFGGLGFAGGSAIDAGEDAGLADSVVTSIQTAAEDAESARWWLLATGAGLLLWFSFSLLRSLRLVQAVAWRQPVPPAPKRAPAAALNVVFSLLAVALFALAMSWVREHGDVVGALVAWLGGIAFFGALWTLVSARLPSPDVPLRAHLPGAVLFGIALWALQVFSNFFLAEKLASSAALYGVLGLAATALFFLYLIGRGIVWAAALNAATWEARRGMGGTDSLRAAGRAADP